MRAKLLTRSQAYAATDRHEHEQVHSCYPCLLGQGQHVVKLAYVGPGNGNVYLRRHAQFGQLSQASRGQVKRAGPSYPMLRATREKFARDIRRAMVASMSVPLLARAVGTPRTAAKRASSSQSFRSKAKRASSSQSFRSKGSPPENTNTGGPIFAADFNRPLTSAVVSSSGEVWTSSRRQIAPGSGLPKKHPQRPGGFCRRGSHIEISSSLR